MDCVVIDLATYPGIGLAFFGVFFLPPLLLIFYRQFEFIEIRPFWTGTLGGILLMGIPFWVLGGLTTFTPQSSRTLLTVGLLALGRGVLAEGGKKLLYTARGYHRGKWIHFMPLGLGFYWGTTLAVLGRVLVLALGTMWGWEMVAAQAADVQWLLSLEGSPMLLFNLFLLGLLCGDLGLTLLNGLSANKGMVGLFVVTVILSGAYLGAALLLTGHFGPLVALYLVYIIGGWLISRLTRDLFSVFVKSNKSFKGLRTYH